MKKIIALILSAVMLLTLVPAVIAAPAVADVGKVASGYTPAGTAIDDLSKITDAAGAYYLTKDITVSASFATTFCTPHLPCATYFVDAIVFIKRCKATHIAFIVYIGRYLVKL